MKCSRSIRAVTKIDEAIRDVRKAKHYAKLGKIRHADVQIGNALIVIGKAIRALNPPTK